MSRLPLLVRAISVARRMESHCARDDAEQTVSDARALRAQAAQASLQAGRLAQESRRLIAEGRAVADACAARRSPAVKR